MQVIYNAVIAQLKEKTTLEWIDLEAGQLEISPRPPLAYPAALVDIQLTNTQDISLKSQLCTALVTIRVASDIYAETNAAAPDDIRADALGYFNIVNDVFVALQGYTDENISPFSRTSQRTEKRNDGLKVIAITFQTQFRDYSAAKDELSGWD